MLQEIVMVDDYSDKGREILYLGFKIGNFIFGVGEPMSAAVFF